LNHGHEGWYAFQVLYPSDYPLNSATIADGGTMQFHGYGGSGNVPFGITAGRLCEGGEGPGTPHGGGSELGYLKAWIKAASPEAKRYCLSKEIHANTVYDILIHARFSEGSDGFCEVFLDGTRVLDFTGAFGFVPQVNSIFTVGPSSTSLTGQTAAKRHKQGTVFSFQLQQSVTVQVALQARTPGRRVGRGCRAASRRLRNRPRCTQAITIATLTRSAHVGLNKVAFSGRIAGKALKPGRYQAVFTAIDSAGSAPLSTLSFTVVKR
jgi:hypothetical protein